MNRSLIITSLFLLATASACQNETAAHTAGVMPPPNEVWITKKQIEQTGIATTEVGDRQVGNVMTATGRIAFSDSRVAHVFSPVTGRVTQMLVSVGEHVSRGTPLAVIASADLGSAAADLEKAEADLTASRRDYERQKELYDAHAAAQRDFEAAESNYRKARAERDRAEQKANLLAVNRSGASDYVLRSPIAGDVVARTVSPGLDVQGQYSGGNAPELFTVGNLDSLWVIADVFEADMRRVHLGAPVTVTVVSYPDRQFTGRVDSIAGALDAGTRTMRVRCTIQNPGHLLRPEMFAAVAIATDTTPKLAIPRTSVVRVGDENVAFVDKGESPNGGERFERRIVAIDDTQAGDYVPVLRGLQSGEKVVSSGAIILTGSSS